MSSWLSQEHMHKAENVLVQQLTEKPFMQDSSSCHSHDVAQLAFPPVEIIVPELSFSQHVWPVTLLIAETSSPSEQLLQLDSSYL